MSLNGLESAEVQEAYQAAVAEAGGWLLLKYASRDSVDLLGRGKGGVHEARATIAKYEAASPVYGVIVYRRRKAVIKYVPEGTSRVLLARTTVHFQDVLEKFAPYDALLEISTSEGLNDTSLAASFPLRTATPSGSSSRLDEIMEDGEDPGPARASPSPVPSARTPTGSYFSSQRKRMEQRMLSDRSVLADRSQVKNSDSNRPAARPTSPLSSNTVSPAKTSVSQFLVRSDSGKPSITSIGSDSIASMAESTTSEASLKEARSSMSTAEPSKTEMAMADSIHSEPPGRASESSAPEVPLRAPGRTNTVEQQHAALVPRESVEQDTTPARQSSSEATDYEKDLFDFLKPKTKLAPRPVTATERAKRPTVASVSSMPATYRFSMRKQEQPQRQAPPVLAPSPLINKPIPLPPPIPETPDYNPRPLSRGSVKSMPSHKSTAMTPDKLRLMKAVELRRKQLRKSNPVPDGFVPPPDEEAPAVPEVPEQTHVNEEAVSRTREPESALARSQAERVADDEVVTSYKADSGIEMDYDKSRIHNKDMIDTHAPPPPPFEAPDPPSPKLPERPSERPSTTPPPTTPPPESPKLAIPGSFRESVPPVFTGLDVVGATNSLTGESSENQSATIPTEEPSVVVSPRDEAAIVPTIQMADGSRPITPNTQQPQDEDTKSVESDLAGKSGDESVSSQGLAAAWEMSPKRNNSELARRRQGYIEPLQVDTDTELSDDEDDFGDELQNAQVEEVKHVVVSRSSPVQEFFPPIRRPSAISRLSDRVVVSRGTGAVSPSSPVSVVTAVNIDAHSREMNRSPPETYRPTAPTLEGNEAPAGPKRNVSSEISKRIQALAGTSSRENTPPYNSTSRPLTPESSTILSSVRNTTHLRNRSFNALNKYSSRPNSNQSNTTKTSSQQSQTGPVWSVQHDPSTNRDSVSVTARIVRPKPSEDLDSADSTDATLQPSQLTINHKRGTSSQTSVPQLQRIDTKSEPLSTPQESTPSLNSTSPTLARGSKESSSLPQTTSLSRAATSPTIDDISLATSSPPLGSPDESAAPKEGGSRTSRFFKRMSNIGGKRKSGMNQLADGASLAAPSKEKVSVQSILLPAVTVGDLNIQFPDSLLWKRRIVAIDDTGSLRLQPTDPTQQHKKATTRRFQLTEFKMPYVPDLDRQELPNSIMLDFADGGTTLQIACEDSVTHLHVSHVLRTYWKAWANTR